MDRKGSAVALLFGLAGFVLVLAFMFSLTSINITSWGLNFTTMSNADLELWYGGLLTLALACLIGGIFWKD